MTQDYERYEYVAHFSGGFVYWNDYTEAAAKVKFWQESQNWILQEVTKLMDQGWEPITEVGPECFTIGFKKRFFDWDFFSWVMYIGLGVATFGIGFVAMPFIKAYTVMFPLEFKVSMRRKLN
jgi:hypothetical protein